MDGDQTMDPHGELLPDTSGLSLDSPDMERKRRERHDRTREVMKAVSSTVTDQILSKTDYSTSEDRAAVCIQRHLRGYFGRKEYLQLLLNQFEVEERMRLEKTMKQVEEGELLVQNHQLEVELDDNQTTRRNKKRHYLSNVITIQRAWRAHQRGLECQGDAGNNNMSPQSPVAESEELSEAESAHGGTQAMSLSTPDNDPLSLSTDNEDIQSDFESSENHNTADPIQRFRDIECESVLSDVSELSAPLRDFAESEVHIVQRENLRKGIGSLPLTDRSTSLGIIERGPRETDEDFSKRVRKLNYLSLAQEFAELKKLNANALPFDLHKNREILSNSTSPSSPLPTPIELSVDTTDGKMSEETPHKLTETTGLNGSELNKGDNSINSTLPKNFKLTENMNRLSMAGEHSLPKNHPNHNSTSSHMNHASPPKNSGCIMAEERRRPANMAKGSPMKERNNQRKAGAGSIEQLEEFEVYNIETTLPQMDWETLEQHLQMAAAEEEKKKEELNNHFLLYMPGLRVSQAEWRGARRNDREEIRRKLAMGAGEEEYYYGERSFRKPSLQTRLQSGMNLQICFMNESTLEPDSANMTENGANGDKPRDGQISPQTSPPLNRHNTPEPKQNPFLSEKKPHIERSSPKPIEPSVAVIEDEDFFRKQARLQDEARMALAQASTMAHMQLEVERQMKKKSPIADMVGIPGFGDGRKRKLTRKMLEGMNLAQIQVLVNDLHSQIENLNEDLVRMLVERDDLHMEQDSMLVDIEDLTRRAQEYASLMHMKQKKTDRRK